MRGRRKPTLKQWLSAPALGYKKIVRPHHCEDAVLLRMMRGNIEYSVIITLKELESAEDWRFLAFIHLVQMRRAIRDFYESA